MNTPEQWADFLALGHTGGVNVQIHNAAVIKEAMEQAHDEALEKVIKIFGPLPMGQDALFKVSDFQVAIRTLKNKKGE